MNLGNVNAGELEVIWPLHRWHYLNVPTDQPLPSDPPPVSDIAADPLSRIGQARGLAARSLQCGAGCSQQRAGALLGVSRRQIGRDTDLSPVTDPAVVERARALIAASGAHGSTVGGTGGRGDLAGRWAAR